jgi:hypothetical protein
MESERQRAARALHGNALLSELFADYRREIYEAWQASRSPEARERAHVLHEAATSIEELISAKSAALAAGDGSTEHQPTDSGDGASSGRNIGREP